MKSYALIVNPVSGKGRGARMAQKLGDVLSASSSVEVFHSTHRGEAIKLAEAAVGRVDRVIAVGGDGTLNEVVSGLMNSGVGALELPELGFLPAGTANAAAKAFRVGSDPASVAKALATAKSRALDVGMVQYDGGERAFLLWFGAGWDGVVIHVLNSDRSGQMGVSGLFGHTPQLLKAIARYDQPPIRAIVDGASFGTCSTVVVGNVAEVGFGGVVAEMADPGDGHFDVVGVPRLSLPRFLRVGYSMMRSSLTRARGITHMPGKKIALEADGGVPFHVDGEALGYLPAKGWVMPGAVRFLETEA